MQLGLTLPGAGSLATAAGLAATAAVAERLGFSSLWAADHVAIPMRFESAYPYAADGTFAWSPERPWLDPFTTLALVGASTSTIRLGTSVLVLPMRHPLLVAKTAASLDYLLGGRLVLGVGAGWLAEEFGLLGQRFRDRFQRMAECVDILRACWSANPVEHRGKAYRLDPFAMSPKPLQRGGPPILIGGHGDRSLSLVARAGDGWHPMNLAPAEYARRLRRLDALLATGQRGMSDVLLTVVVDSRQLTTGRLVDDYARLGVTEMVLDIDYSHGSLEIATAEMERLSQFRDCA